MINLNSLDLAILFFISLSCCAGSQAGILRSAFNVAGVIAGLIAATRYYPHGGSLLAAQCGLPQGWADLISLILFFTFIYLTVTGLGSVAASLARFRPVKIADRIGGGAAGIGIGALITGALLTVLAAFPLNGSMQEYLDGSFLAPRLIESSSTLYEKIEARLPIDIPKLAFYPEELTGPGPNRAGFRLVNFNSLDKATCFVCEEKVTFLGYRLNSRGTISPKFICSGCGRTSDGCQTYEGHHLLYDRCPVVLGRQGYRFDCGIWPNGSYHRPAGRCPVCGEEE